MLLPVYVWLPPLLYFLWRLKQLVPPYQTTRRRIPDHRNQNTTLRTTNLENKIVKCIAVYIDLEKTEFGVEQRVLIELRLWSVCNPHTQHVASTGQKGVSLLPFTVLTLFRSGLRKFRPKNWKGLVSFEWRNHSPRVGEISGWAWPFAWSNSPSFMELGESLLRS